MGEPFQPGHEMGPGGRGRGGVGVGREVGLVQERGSWSDIRVGVGRRSFRAIHRLLPQDEAVGTLADHEDRNHFARPVINRMLISMAGWHYDGSPPTDPASSCETPTASKWNSSPPHLCPPEATYSKETCKPGNSSTSPLVLRYLARQISLSLVPGARAAHITRSGGGSRETLRSAIGGSQTLARPLCAVVGCP